MFSVCVPAQIVVKDCTYNPGYFRYCIYSPRQLFKSSFV